MPTLAEIQKRLQELKEQGYIPSKRRGPTGIGFTFEKCMGLDETNLQLPDLRGRVELKATRRSSTSLITLFTFNKGAWKVHPKEVIQKFGYIDESGREGLYTTVWANQVNSQGFMLKVDKNTNTVTLLRGDAEIASWSIYRLVGALLYKLGKVLYVIADSRVNKDGTEEFHFNEAYLLEDPHEENFINAFNNSITCIDIRMHINKNGGVRNHGTAIRIKEGNLDCLFKTKRHLII